MSGFASQGRPEPPHEADERATLIGFLEFQRATLELKCAGLTPAQLAERAVSPSALSLLGLVRHLTENERSWFGEVLGQQTLPVLYGDDDFAVDPASVDAAQVEAAFAAWRAECERSREIVAGIASLDVVVPDVRVAHTARWIIAHMIEEYARHNGHADLLRERIDGSTGE